MTRQLLVKTIKVNYGTLSGIVSVLRTAKSFISQPASHPFLLFNQLSHTLYGTVIAIMRQHLSSILRSLS